MFRRVITSYLIAIILAGPGVCCCSLSHAFSSDSASTDTSQAAPSCCHSKTDKQSPGKPDSCPCRKHRERLVVSSNDESSKGDDGPGAAHWQPNVEPALAGSGDLFSAGDPGHLARQALFATYLNSRSLLRAISVMRC